MLVPPRRYNKKDIHECKWCKSKFACCGDCERMCHRHDEWLEFPDSVDVKISRHIYKFICCVCWSDENSFSSGTDVDLFD